MKTYSSVMIALAAMLAAHAAHATLVLNVADKVGAIPQPPGNINPERISDAVGVAEASVGSMLYKDNRGGSEEGSFSASYATTFQNGGVGTTVITWGGPGVIGSPTYLVLKPGNLDSYVWDISGWNGTDTIEIPYPWSPNVNAVSHVEIYGTLAVVPEPSTYIAGALLGLPFVAGLVRRNRRSRAQA